MIQVEKLDNQIEVIMETVDTTETVSIGFWFTHGSRDEANIHSGYTHFLEHMLFKGTEKRSPRQIALEMDRVGGAINAFTEKEFTCFYCTIPRRHFHLAIDILTDMIFHSILKEDEIAKEKTVIINEIQATYDAPEELAHEIFFDLLWKDHPLAKKIAGEEKDIKTVTREKLLQYYREIFLKSGMVISIAGKFDPPEAMRILEDSLPPWSFASHPSEPPKATHFNKFIKDKFTQVQIYTGTILPGYRTVKEFYRVLLFSTIVGESMSSRLFQKIREDMGLCYSIYSFRNFFLDSSLWMIYSSTASQFVLPLLNAINSEFQDLKKNMISAEELENAKSHLEGNLLLSREDMENRMKRLARLYLFTGTPIEHSESIDQIHSVTMDELAETLHTILNPEITSILTYGNKDRIKWKNFRFNF